MCKFAQIALNIQFNHKQNGNGVLFVDIVKYKGEYKGQIMQKQSFKRVTMLVDYSNSYHIYRKINQEDTF